MSQCWSTFPQWVGSRAWVRSPSPCSPKFTYKAIKNHLKSFLKGKNEINHLPSSRLPLPCPWPPGHS